MTLEELLKLCTQEEASILKLLKNAYLKNAKEIGEDPSAQTLKAMAEAEKMFEEKKAQLEEKYAQPEESTASGPNWESYEETSTKFEVLIFLQETGWEIKKQTFYNHCSSGKLQKNRSGLYSKRAVKKYAETWLVHSGLGDTVSGAEESLQREKTIEEIKRIKAVTRREELRLEKERGQLIARDDVERELASRAVVLDQGLEYLIQTAAPEIVALVKGDPAMMPQLIEFLLARKNERMNAFARMDDFTVIMELDEVIPLAAESESLEVDA